MFLGPKLPELEHWYRNATERRSGDAILPLNYRIPEMNATNGPVALLPRRLGVKLFGAWSAMHQVC